VRDKSGMRDITRMFIEDSRAFLNGDYLPKIESCLEVLTDEDVWWRPNEESNSIGNLLLHLEGSTRGWIINTAGGGDSQRKRQDEFDEREHVPASELLARLKRTLAQADEVLTRLTAEELIERRKSSYEEVTVFWAVYHAVEHFAMHTGQIILLTKIRAEHLQLTI
jgi:uncharacterized damage-inducible protein DinB